MRQPEHRLCGVFTVLMAYIEHLALMWGAPEVRLNVLLANSALRHWLNRDYEVTGYIVLRKPIRPAGVPSSSSGGQR